METVNDLDGDLVNFWTVLRDRPTDLERVCALTPHSRQEHMAVWTGESALDSLERARRTWIQLTQNHGNQRHHRSGWKHAQSANIGISVPRYLAAYVNRIAPCAARLHGVSLEHRPALDVIRDYGQYPTTLLYVDPPYLAKRAAGYAVEMTDESDHTAMLDALASVNASVLLSGYANDLYDRALSGWQRIEIRTGTGQSSERFAERVEVLWFNYDPPALEQTFDFGGVPA